MTVESLTQSGRVPELKRLSLFVLSEEMRKRKILRWDQDVRGSNPLALIEKVA